MAKSEIFVPPISQAFIDHYKLVYPPEGLSDTEIKKKVYGGTPLTELYTHFELVKAENLPKRKLDQHQQWADIRLIADPNSGRQDLTLKGVSLRQFLIAGLPYIQCGTSEGCPHSGQWDGENHWFELNPQYRLELCHSEISRWSLFFKEDGKLASDLKPSQISGDENITRIELVNNCTTSRGFEFRITLQADGGDEEVYHGSFGKDGMLDSIYRDFSQLQAGALAEQTRNLADGNQHPGFGFDNDDIYFNFAGWNGLDQQASGHGQGAPENTIKVQLSRYMCGRSFQRTTADCPELKLNYGEIKYDRWGGGEYFDKPQKRNLMISMFPPIAGDSKAPPVLYEHVYNSSEIKLPDFPPRGIYNIANPQPKRSYGRLAELSRCTANLIDNRWLWLELHRVSGEGSFEFRRIVFGNLDITKIPEYKASTPKKSFWTMHRFGFGARETKQDYKEPFALPHEEKDPVHFGYLLAGTSRDASQAEHYVCPESFGVERAIFTWESKTELVIDLISFERILPVWQGKITFASDFFQSQLV